MIKGIFILTFLILIVYWQFFLQGKIPVPGDMVIGAYFPWLDYKWGFPTGVPVKNPSISDVYSQFFLWKYLSVDFIKLGIWPLWDPYSLSGSPFLATYTSAVLFPFNLLLFLPKYFGWGFYVFLQTLMAALGMYFLIGRYIKNIYSQIAGALVFSLSGLMSTWVEFGTAVWAAAALPWIFYSLESYLQSSKLRYLFLLTVSLIFLILAGHAQVTTYGLALLGLYLLVNRKKVVYPIFFIILGLLICAIQLLPTIEFTNLSIRAVEKYAQSFNFGLTPIQEAIKIIVPDFFGSPVTYNQWNSGIYYEYASFLGTLTLPLILPLLLKRFSGKKEIFWLMVLGVSFLLAFQNPISVWIYNHDWPLFTYSFASRILFISSFSAAILVGFGINRFTTNSTFLHWLRRSTVLISAILGGVIVGMAVILFLIKPYTSPEIEKIVSNFSIALRNSILPSWLLLSLFFITFFKKFTRWSIYLLIILIFLDMFRFFYKYNPFVDNKLIFPTTPIIDYLKNQKEPFRIARADPEVMPPNTWTAYKLESIEGYNPLYLESYGRLFKRANAAKAEGGLSRYAEIHYFPNKFIDALNTKYFLAIKRDKDGRTPGDILNYKIMSSEYKKVYEDKSVVVLENPNVKKRAYFISDLIPAKDNVELLNMIDNQSFDPTTAAVNLNGKSGKFDTNGSVKIDLYLPNKVALTTDRVTPGFLVLADNYDSGWHLNLDGKEETIYQVNESLRGMMVPAGIHHFEMEYWPKSFDVGLKITFVGMIILIYAMRITIRKKIW